MEDIENIKKRLNLLEILTFATFDQVFQIMPPFVQENMHELREQYNKLYPYPDSPPLNRKEP